MSKEPGFTLLELARSESIKRSRVVTLYIYCRVEFIRPRGRPNKFSPACS